MVTEEISTTKAEADKAAVLVVDDEYGPRESVAFTLSTEFAVDTAERAAEALTKIRQQPYAAIVLDIRMPEMDGIRALEEIRKIDPLVSIIMLTGYGTLSTAQQAMIGGANQYLRKPPDVDELIESVRKQSQITRVRRHQAKLAQDAQDLSVALKREISEHEPQIWQGKASVEMVHDLNNPLTVVIGYSTLLVEEARTLAEHDPERMRRVVEYANMVEKAAAYCHHLSENWRLASRQTKEFTRLDIVEVARDVRQVIFFSNVAIELAGEAQAPVVGSKYELMRVFQNLFKNAIEAGSTRVIATFTRKDKFFEIVIEDNGGGMSEEEVRRSLHGGFTSKATGTGLGLNICRHLMGAHGGTFDLESHPPKGTTIRLTIPVAQDA